MWAKLSQPGTHLVAGPIFVQLLEEALEVDISLLRQSYPRRGEEENDFAKLFKCTHPPFHNIFAGPKYHKIK